MNHLEYLGFCIDKALESRYVDRIEYLRAIHEHSAKNEYNADLYHRITKRLGYRSNKISCDELARMVTQCRLDRYFDIRQGKLKKLGIKNAEKRNR